MGKHWIVWQLTGSRALTGTNLPWTSLAFTHMHKSKPVKPWCSAFGSKPVLLELLHSRAIWKVWKYQVSHFWALLLIRFWRLKSAPTLSCQMHHFNSYTTHSYELCPLKGITSNISIFSAHIQVSLTSAHTQVFCLRFPRIPFLYMPWDDSALETSIFLTSQEASAGWEPPYSLLLKQF